MNTISVQQINIVISVIACITSIFIARSAWQRRRIPGANWFFGLVVCIVWVTFWYIFEAASGFDLDTYMTFAKLEYVGLMYIPVAWLGFTMTYGSKSTPLSKRILRLLLLIPLITIFFAWTNEWHGLIWKVPRLVAQNGVPIFEPEYGRWFWVSALFNYSIFMIGSVTFFRQIVGTWRVYRAQGILLLVSNALPWLGNVLQIFDNLNPFPGIYVNAFFLSTAMLGLMVGLFRLRLLDLAPLARETILENLPVGYVVVDEQARIIAFNEHVKPFLDNVSEDVIGRKLGEIFPSLSLKTDNQAFEEQQQQFKDQIVEVQVAPVLDGNQNWRGQLFIFNNVTSRVQAQQALEQSEKRQRALLEAQPDLMFRIRGDGTYLDYHAGHAGTDMMPAEPYVGRNLRDIGLGEGVERDLNYIKQVLETRTMAAYEFTAANSTGENHDYEARIVASGADEVVAIVRNIDERKQAERRAFALALERERVTMISQFIQDTSHEFRTPLSVIRVSLHLLKRAETAEKRESRAARIEEQINRLTRLVDMLVKMSTLDGDVQLDFRLSNINKLVEMVYPAGIALFTPPDLAIVYEQQANLPPVEVDQEQFIQAIRELIDNASQHTPSGGTITVRTHSDDEHVTVEVQDTGKGISPEAIPHLFERFYRLDHAHSTPGFGLGLAIVQRIIELHSGSIRVESTEGKGSRFIIRLPCHQKPTSDERLP